MCPTGVWVIKALGIRSVDKVAVLYLCIRAFQLLQRKGERETDTGFCRVRASGATGSLVKPWLRQTGCTALWGRFNYKWCFHSEPSWIPLFFRRSSSPNPRQGSVWPVSEVICLTHIACHALWMMGRRRSYPNFLRAAGASTPDPTER